MKYAACTFSDKPGQRAYDYAIPEGLDLKPGDVVRVPAPAADGFKKVHVVELKDHTDAKPEWIKTIIEIHTEEDNEQEKMEAGPDN